MPPSNRASYLAGELSPVPLPTGSPSGRIAFGLVAAVLVVLVGVSLVGQTGGDRPGSQAVIAGPTPTTTPDAVRTDPPLVAPGATSSPTALLPPPGTPPPRVSVAVGPVPTCPPRSRPDAPGPVNQARPVGFVGHAAFDRQAGRLVVVSDSGTDIETWTFDVCTNTWARMHPNREPPSFEWRPLVYDVDSDLTLGIAYGPDGGPPGNVWAYDLEADSWTEKPAPVDAALRAYDPLTGLVLATKGTSDDMTSLELLYYDVQTDTWMPIGRVNGPEWFGVVTYDASVDRIVAVGAQTWLGDIRTGTWSRSGAETPNVQKNWFAVPAATYDEAAERTVTAGSSGCAAYDAAADRWETLSGLGGSFANPIAYDPVNRRLIRFGPGGAYEGDVVGLDLVTREWTVLLGPSEGQAAPP